MNIDDQYMDPNGEVGTVVQTFRHSGDSEPTLVVLRYDDNDRKQWESQFLTNPQQEDK